MGIEEIVFVVSTLLVIVGALNWGAYALGHNLVEKIGNKNIQKSIYYLIAISGVVSLVFFIRYKGSKAPITTHKPATRTNLMPVGDVPKSGQNVISVSYEWVNDGKPYDIRYVRKTPADFYQKDVYRYYHGDLYCEDRNGDMYCPNVPPVQSSGRGWWTVKDVKSGINYSCPLDNLEPVKRGDFSPCKLE